MAFNSLHVLHEQWLMIRWEASNEMADGLCLNWLPLLIKHVDDLFTSVDKGFCWRKVFSKHLCYSMFNKMQTCCPDRSFPKSRYWLTTCKWSHKEVVKLPLLDICDFKCLSLTITDDPQNNHIFLLSKLFSWYISRDNNTKHCNNPSCFAEYIPRPIDFLWLSFCLKYSEPNGPACLIISICYKGSPETN